MWKAERFAGSDDKDPLEQLIDFVNARHLLPGQFQFTVATDEEGYQYCLLVYTEQKPAPPPAPRPTEGGRQPTRFGPPGEEGARRPPRGQFRPQFGPPSEGGFRRGQRGRPGGPPGAGGGQSGPRGGRGKPPPKRGR